MNLATCNNVNRAIDYYAKQNKSVREKRILYGVSHMWNLRNKTNEHSKEETERERQTKNQTLNSKEQTDDYQMGGVWGMSEKDDGDKGVHLV